MCRQEWHILAPRVRKVHRLTMDNRKVHGTSSPTEFLFNNKNSWNAWSKLAIPAAPRRARAPRALSRRARRPCSLSGLESLPSELLASIIEDSALEKRDLVALALASTTLWAHVLSHVEKECSLAKPPMAGVELACTGTYLVDLPELFAKDDLAKSSVEFQQSRYMCEARTINFAALSAYEAVEETIEEAWRFEWKMHAEFLEEFPVRLAKTLKTGFLGRCDAFRGHGAGSLWVLRNLTTREFVRCRARKGPSGVRGYVDCGVEVRVDDVLLLRICWTAVGVGGDWEGLGIYRGKWAGHCFDIVPRERLEGVEGWRDCTEEVVEQAKEVAENMRPLGMASITPSRRKRKAEA